MSSTCPMCAETIDLSATTCPHCGSKLTPSGFGESLNQNAPPRGSARPARSQWLIPSVLGVAVSGALVAFAINRARPTPLQGMFQHTLVFAGIPSSEITFVFQPDGTATQYVGDLPNLLPLCLSWRTEGQRIEVRNTGGDTWSFTRRGDDQLLLVARDSESVPDPAVYSRVVGRQARQANCSTGAASPEGGPTVRSAASPAPRLAS